MAWSLKTAGSPECPLWLTDPDVYGKRSFSKRPEVAATFVTRRDAQDVFLEFDRTELPPELSMVVFYVVENGERKL
jgi:hypothetical protein